MDPKEITVGAARDEGIPLWCWSCMTLVEYNCGLIVRDMGLGVIDMPVRASCGCVTRNWNQKLFVHWDKDHAAGFGVVF